MTDTNRSPHSPSPEFTDYLARDIARSLRHEARFAKRSSTTVARRVGVITMSCIGAVVVLAVGLAFGNSTGYASARVESAQRRNALASKSMDVTSQLAALRVSISRTRENLAHAASTNGGASRLALRAAESDLASLEASAVRIETDQVQSEMAVGPLTARNIPMKRALSLACTALAMAAPGESTAAAPMKQQGVPIIDLPAATVKSASTFGVVTGVRDVPGGRVLINDGRRRQLKLLDSSLATLSVVFDSTPGTATSYGYRPIPLVRYLGDSSLTVDFDAGTLLMLGPTGQITRAVSSPYAQAVPPYASLITSLGRQSGVDDRGRIVFGGPHDMVRPGMTNEERVAAMGKDTEPIMRADLESRRVDTLTFVRTGGTTALMGRVTPTSAVRFSRMPVEIVDVWGVLSDGTIGIVRGRDYHVDWILPDGSRRSTAKLPFDWKRLSDEEKQRLIDSVRKEAGATLGSALAQGQPATPDPATGGGGGVPGARVYVPPEQRPPQRAPLPMEYLPPALKDIPDYYPSVRIGAAIADRDGNLWILPNSTAQSRNGELVYDVVNPKGDFHRVRLPVGRSILGFGKGGVVYLASGDRTDGFVVERTRLPHPGQSQLAPMRQPVVPVVTLSAATAKTSATLGLVSGIHQMADGKVLVNDAGHRLLRLFDPSLETSMLVADSTSGNSNSYGPAPVQLIRYRGDSTLFPDLGTQSLLVLDGAARVARTIALPNTRDFPNFIVSFAGVDTKGRLLYRGSGLGPPIPGGPLVASDSAPILRADLEQRRVDTLGRIKVRDGGAQNVDRSDPAKVRITTTINPLPLLDEWSVLADGSVALVRGHDYHIDWVRADGTMSSSPRIPFDWKRLTDEDKQKIVDSARVAQLAAEVRRLTNNLAAGGGGGGGRRGGGDPGGDPAARQGPPQIRTVFVPLKDMTDFYPPLRRGATVPDLDGNLWILPTTSAQSQSGELVYDVVNAQGELFERVRLPVGRSLAGFGKGGVVYLLFGDRTNGFALERTKLPGGSSR
jgi:hypothetical protein